MRNATWDSAQHPVSFFHSDHLGSTRLVTNSSGAVEQITSYHPFGATLGNGGTANVPYKYTGQELDETGLYDYHARLYDPVLGRFISADTLVPNPGNPQDLNRYTYAHNNPLLYTDPSGHFGIIEGIIFGVVIGAVASGIQSDWDLGSMIVGGIIGGASGGAGAGVATSSVMQATLSSLGQPWAGVAGGIIAGAAAGGTGGVLASAMGYKVNIGLAIASGAAAGGIVGGAAGQWGQGGAFLAAPAAGASAAAIRGADSGVGALIAAGTAAFSLGIQYGYHEIYNYMAENGKPSVLVASGDCSPTCAFRSEPTSTGSHDLQISISMGESTYSFSLFSGKVETGSTIPPSWGIGLEVSLYKPAELLAPQSLDIGVMKHTSVGKYFYYNPEFDGSNQQYISQGLHLSLGPSWPPTPFSTSK